MKKLQLHPFFSYFGSKYRLAKYYPEPKYDNIIEPFAGAAGYSLLYHNKNITLYDSYEPIIQLWNYLIKVKEEEIISLPLLQNNKEFSKENPLIHSNICEEAKILIGFWLTESQTYSSTYPLSKSRGGNWTERKKNMLASQLKYIRHWKAEIKDYQNIDLNDKNITWFVDPPYVNAGKRYKKNEIDYELLAMWCKNKSGQVIVCEQQGAKWLEFKKIRKNHNGSNKQYSELFWINSV